MKLEDVGETIAIRRLTLLHGDGPPSEVVVLLGKPILTPGYDDYDCPYQIQGAGSRRLRYMCGIDAFQALQLAIRALGCDLDVLNGELDGNLRWEGDEKGNLGFPERSETE